MTRFVNSLVSAVGASWCQLMHPDPMWPVNGHYQCRVCLRKYPVSWEAPETEAMHHHHQHAPAGESISAATASTAIH
jgi:hypothetical protein